jgi:hypothetical protein
MWTKAAVGAQPSRDRSRRLGRVPRRLCHPAGHRAGRRAAPYRRAAAASATGGVPGAGWRHSLRRQFLQGSSSRTRRPAPCLGDLEGSSTATLGRIRRLWRRRVKRSPHRQFQTGAPDRGQCERLPQFHMRAGSSFRTVVEANQFSIALGQDIECRVIEVSATGRWRRGPALCGIVRRLFCTVLICYARCYGPVRGEV